jgi:succinate dehydrogenase/fumarate reductase cytochrome b subunit
MSVVRSRGVRISGAASLAYVLWYVGDLVLLQMSPSAFNAVHRFYGNVGVRAVFACVFLAVVVHGLHGLRVTMADLIPVVGRHDTLARTVVAFVTFSAWIPATVILLWPQARWWFSR